MAKETVKVRLDLLLQIESALQRDNYGVAKDTLADIFEEVEFNDKQ